MEQETQSEIFYEETIEHFEKIASGSVKGDEALKQLAQGLRRFAQAQLVQNRDISNRLKQLEDSLRLR
jgi:hypothetical protein